MLIDKTDLSFGDAPVPGLSRASDASAAQSQQGNVRSMGDLGKPRALTKEEYLKRLPQTVIKVTRSCVANCKGHIVRTHVEHATKRCFVSSRACRTARWFQYAAGWRKCCPAKPGLPFQDGTVQATGKETSGDATLCSFGLCHGSTIVCLQSIRRDAGYAGHSPAAGREATNETGRGCKTAQVCTAHCLVAWRSI